MCSCDFDAPEFYTETLRRSRRARSCDDCGKAIAAGDYYVHVSGKWEYDIDTFALCNRCVALGKAMTMAGCCAALTEFWSTGVQRSELEAYLAAMTPGCRELCYEMPPGSIVRNAPGCAHVVPHPAGGTAVVVSHCEQDEDGDYVLGVVGNDIVGLDTRTWVRALSVELVSVPEHEFVTALREMVGAMRGPKP